MVTTNDHRFGMRISCICAWGTSKLACDGSGYVLLGKEGGFKTYEEKVPQCSKRSTSTLSALINLNTELMSIEA